MKKSFTLLEVVLVISLIAIAYTFFIPNYKVNKLEELTSRIELYLSYLRYQAMIDDKFENHDLWYKKRWTLKFFNCNKEVGGLYFSIYSDSNYTGKPKAIESMKDPLTNKYIFNTNFCKDNSKYSKYSLLTKYYGVKKVEISCNKTSTIGQISFGSDGKLYSRLGTKVNENSKYEITEPCFIKFINNENKEKVIKVYPKTGYVEQL